MLTLACWVFDTGSKLNGTLNLVLAVLVLELVFSISSKTISIPDQSIQAKYHI